jgi:ribonucleoside-diphosphate reductase alpha chain
MTCRHRLPNRRPAETFEIDVGGLRYACTVGRYPDDTIGEIFLSANKNGSAADVSARDSAIAISLGLQHGISLHDFARTVTRDEQGRVSSPAGRAIDSWLGNNPQQIMPGR